MSDRGLIRERTGGSVKGMNLTDIYEQLRLIVCVRAPGIRCKSLYCKFSPLVEG